MVDKKVDIISVRLDTCNDVKKFVEFAQMANGKITCKQYDYCVDGKSILGVMSLDTSVSFNVKFVDCSETEISKFQERWGI